MLNTLLCTWTSPGEGSCECSKHCLINKHQVLCEYALATWAAHEVTSLSYSGQGHQGKLDSTWRSFQNTYRPNSFRGFGITEGHRGKQSVFWINVFGSFFFFLSLWRSWDHHRHRDLEGSSRRSRYFSNWWRVRMPTFRLQGLPWKFWSSRSRLAQALVSLDVRPIGGSVMGHCPPETVGVTHRRRAGQLWERPGAPKCSCVSGPHAKAAWRCQRSPRFVVSL